MDQSTFVLCGTFEVCDGVQMLRIECGVLVVCIEAGELRKQPEFDSGCQTIALPRLVVDDVLYAGPGLQENFSTL